MLSFYGEVWRWEVMGWRSLREGLEVEGCGVEVFRVEVWRLKVVGWRSLGEGLEVEGCGVEVFKGRFGG
ncbi:MAG: hypothetical protein PUH57_03970 [Prevotellaceae bacterium]|nr:hypothetical protein [Prevotellaceae bacterium]MDY2749801.1 hypothetical protein [Prevotella sp.]